MHSELFETLEYFPISQKTPFIFPILFTGSDEKICLIESKCINLFSNKGEIDDEEMLVCAFDNVKGGCPSATQCLKDPTVKIDFVRISKTIPLYCENFILIMIFIGLELYLRSNRNF